MEDTTDDVAAVLADASRLRDGLAAMMREINRGVDDRVVAELGVWLTDPGRVRPAVQLLGVMRPSYTAHLIGRLVPLILADDLLADVVALIGRVRPEERDEPVARHAFLLYENYPEVDAFRRLETLLDRAGLRRPAMELADVALSSADAELREEAAEYLAELSDPA